MFASPLILRDAAGFRLPEPLLDADLVVARPGVLAWVGCSGRVWMGTLDLEAGSFNVHPTALVVAPDALDAPLRLVGDLRLSRLALCEAERGVQVLDTRTDRILLDARGNDHGFPSPDGAWWFRVAPRQVETIHIETGQVHIDHAWVEAKARTQPRGGCPVRRALGVLFGVEQRGDYDGLWGSLVPTQLGESEPLEEGLVRPEGICVRPLDRGGFEVFFGCHGRVVKHGLRVDADGVPRPDPELSRVIDGLRPDPVDVSDTPGVSWVLALDGFGAGLSAIELDTLRRIAFPERFCPGDSYGAIQRVLPGLGVADVWVGTEAGACLWMPGRCPRLLPDGAGAAIARLPEGLLTTAGSDGRLLRCFAIEST